MPNQIDIDLYESKVIVARTSYVKMLFSMSSKTSTNYTEKGKLFAAIDEAITVGNTLGFTEKEVMSRIVDLINLIFDV
jgi:hypothetical protein